MLQIARKHKLKFEKNEYLPYSTPINIPDVFGASDDTSDIWAVDAPEDDSAKSLSNSAIKSSDKNITLDPIMEPTNAELNSFLSANKFLGLSVDPDEDPEA